MFSLSSPALFLIVFVFQSSSEQVGSNHERVKRFDPTTAMFVGQALATVVGVVGTTVKDLNEKYADKYIPISAGYCRWRECNEECPWYESAQSVRNCTSWLRAKVANFCCKVDGADVSWAGKYVSTKTQKEFKCSYVNDGRENTTRCGLLSCLGLDLHTTEADVDVPVTGTTCNQVVVLGKTGTNFFGIISFRREKWIKVNYRPKNLK